MHPLAPRPVSTFSYPTLQPVRRHSYVPPAPRFGQAPEKPTWGQRAYRSIPLLASLSFLLGSGYLCLKETMIQKEWVSFPTLAWTVGSALLVFRETRELLRNPDKNPPDPPPTNPNTTDAKA